MPERIQRKRTRGWTMPPGAVYVGRPSRWGNPYCACGRETCKHALAYSARQAKAYYRELVTLADAADRECVKRNGLVPNSAEIREHLAGRDLACWCPLDQPCHADVLLRIANEEVPNVGA